MPGLDPSIQTTFLPELRRQRRTGKPRHDRLHNQMVEGQDDANIDAAYLVVTSHNSRRDDLVAVVRATTQKGQTEVKVPIIPAENDFIR